MKTSFGNIFRELVLLLLFLISATNIFAQQQNEDALIDTIKSRFIKQAILFPQEKIYIHVDKPYYISGETIWFRAHLVDAVSNIPDTTSRYVYTELINPHGIVVCRVKNRLEKGVYSGYIDLQEDIPEGEYLLRSYTKFMMNLDENYFFKRKINIGGPLASLYRTEAEFEYKENNKQKIQTRLRFTDIENGRSILPEAIRIKDNKGNIRKINADKDSIVRISLEAILENKNSLYIEYDYIGKCHKQFIPISLRNPDFHVDFFPEGGSLVENTPNKIAFKALNQNGLGEDITGVVINESGDTITSFSSEHQGMGYFVLNTTCEEKIHAICTNGKQEKTFVLPSDYTKTGIQTLWKKNKLLIHIRKSSENVLSDSLYLVVHNRGILLSIIRWDKERDFMFIEKEKLPAGVIHLLLVDSQLNPVSERLIFNHDKNSLANYKFSTDKIGYKKREQVKISLCLRDILNNSLSANLSVSVTDNKDVEPDSSINILTSMLLTSDLQGYIESPAYYFEKEDTETVKHLDILMMTQGWRRYNIKKILKGNIEKPLVKMETSQQISGIVKGGLMMNKTSANYPVTILSVNYNMLEQTLTDPQGRFVFGNFELPDSAGYVVQGRTKKQGKGVKLILDEDVFPEIKRLLPHTGITNRNIFKDYIQKADQKFVLENGMRMVYLKDVEVTAKRISKSSSPYSSPTFNTIITSEQIEKKHANNMLDLLLGIAGVMVTDSRITIRNNSVPPLILLDNIAIDFDEFRFIPVQDVEEIEIAKDAAGMSIFGSRGGNGVIMITTKTGEGIRPQIERYNIKTITPLGYQITKEFYSPKYETLQQKENPEPDLRSTIYWNPKVKTDESGNALIDFYTADSLSVYSVIIEGVTSDGKIVYATGEIKVD